MKLRVVLMPPRGKSRMGGILLAAAWLVVLPVLSRVNTTWLPFTSIE